MRDAIFLYGRYMLLSIQSAMAHRASFVLLTLGQMLASLTTLLGIHFMFLRFTDVGGYSYHEVLLCFSIVLVQYSLAEMLARGFDTFSGMVRRGEFDRVLLRPRGAAFQVMGSRLELTRLGRLALAAGVLGYAVTTGTVVWTPARAVTLVMMLLGGAALFGGLFMVYAALCFFTLEGLECMNILTDGAREYGKYPLDVYGKRFLRLTTVVVPYALIQYYPLQYLLGRSGSGLCALCPLGGGLFLLACHALWRFGVRHYQSSGS